MKLANCGSPGKMAFKTERERLVMIDDDDDVVIFAAEIVASHSAGVCSGASLLHLH